MLAKIKRVHGALSAVALALLLAGCTPAGPRALWNGKKCLDRGDLAEALTQFKQATTLLATNATAWNYLGVALQRAGRADEAATAYQTALRLDHGLVEAHFNLGVLSLEQNQPEMARSELTAYTLRRPNDPAGWLKLGFAQLKAGGNILSAERSFSSVLSLKANEAEAYNGLGLASLQAGKPRDAAQFFAAAVQLRPHFAPALLNLATVNLEYLHDHKAALAGYQSYLALTPRPANGNEIQALVARLAQSELAATVMAPAVVIKTSSPPPELKPRNASGTPPPPAPASRPESEETHASQPPLRIAAGTPPAPAVVASPVVPPPVVTQPVRVPPEVKIVVAPRTNQPNRTTAAAAPRPATNVVAQPLVALPVSEASRRLTSADTSARATKPGFGSDLAAPMPANQEEMAGAKPEGKPPEPKPQPVPHVPRYAYQSPAKPAAGDRRAAEAPFNLARLAEQAEKWAEAEQYYVAAAAADPSWFQAQYNAGVIAHRLHDYSVALPRYELALANQPDSGNADSVNARYNFALALRSTGYSLDAAEELKKILAVKPDEIRAHLALGNLCAQSLHDVAQARQHFLRVLELQPDIPQAGDIRFWLSANAKP